MHVLDGILSPAVCLGCGVISAAAVGYSLRRMRHDLGERAVPCTGMAASLIFAAQMVNFPLFVVPVSGHLIGGVLAAALLGPWAGCVALTLVLVVQSLLFGDGGLLSLGVNVLNMAVVGSWLGGAIYAGLRRMLGSSTRAVITSAVCAAYLTVLAAAICFCVEFGLSHRHAEFDLSRAFGWMIVFHAAIGVGEAMITGLIVRFLLVRRPEMLQSLTLVPSPGWSMRRYVAAGLCCSLVIAVCLAPFASAFPDGLEAVGDQLNFNSLGTAHASVLSDYEIPLPAGIWPALSVSLAGLCGTLVVFAAGWLLGRAVRPGDVE